MTDERIGTLTSLAIVAFLVLVYLGVWRATW
jgi:hypothetical protein